MSRLLDHPRNAGRVVGALMLAAGVLAPVVNFKLLPPGTSRDYLATAAANAAQIRAAVLLMLVLAGLTLAIALVAWPIIRQGAGRLALAVIALSVAGIATFAAEGVAVLNMLGLSEAGASDPVIGATARSAWRNSHFANLLVGYARLVVFGLALYWSAAVPRAVAALVVGGALVSTPGFVLPILNYPFNAALMAPIGITQLVVIGWLLGKGFNEPRTTS